MASLIIDSYESLFDVMATVWHLQNGNNKKKVYVAFWKAYKYDLEDLKKAVEAMSLRQHKYFPSLGEIHSEMVWIDKLRPKKESSIAPAENAAERVRDILKSIKLRKLEF